MNTDIQKLNSDLIVFTLPESNTKTQLLWIENP
jgi:hypothetical protein